MLTGEARARAEAEYEAKQAVLATLIAACPACKAAATRKARAIATLAETNLVITEEDRYWEAKINAEYRKVRRAAHRPDICKRHAERSRLNYVCSPISETYWCS